MGLCEGPHMHTRLLAGPVAVLILLGGTVSARAGIYHPAEGYLRPSTPGALLEQVDKLRTTASPSPNPQNPNPYHEEYLAKVAALEGLNARGLLTTLDRVNLGAYYLRLNKPDKAREVLEVVPDDQRNFLVLANLATAYHLSGMPDRALFTQQQVLDSWPDMWPGLTGADLLWFRLCERSFLNLLRSRQQEPPRRPGDLPPDVDSLFPGLKFVGPGGEYRPGEIAAQQWDKLPPRADQTVAQLVLWLPFDDRLYWLLAELFNVQGGDALKAGEMMEDLVVRRGFHPPLLRQHRQILMDEDVRKTLKVLTTDQALTSVVFSLWSFAPRGVGMAPGAAGGFLEIGWTAGLTPGLQNPPPNPGKPGIPSTILPDLGSVLVGGAAGIVVGVLLTLQVRALRKPRTPVAG